ncbi:hypothetical protein M9Y10_015375 [Tritrichomonas musculus]|uniref:Uncharacterized protein n=1 Tax=Tritrichomonas musculus TaxID=1915356 RepID=A0ABR2L246_9EUKA
MIVFLCFTFFINATIPNEYKNLVKKAITNSKTKVRHEERVNTAFPGDYSFPNVEFKLRQTVSSPNTNDIKGYAIENLTVAIVKRKAFNLNENFVFVDPLEQKLYNMSVLVASDEKVNIYHTKDITIFDIMTNFKYNGKSNKAISPKFNLNWNESKNGPKVRKIPQIEGFQYGIGAYGNILIDTSFRFSSITDISLSALLMVNIKSAAEIGFKDGDSQSSEEFELFKLPSIPIKGLGVSFKFVGIEFVIQPFIKCDAIMNDLSIKVPDKVNYFKGYELIGKKRIEITPFSIVDSKWDIKIYNLPEENSLDEVIEQIKQASFHIVPAIRLYLSIEIKVGGIETGFDVGLKVPFAFDFTFDRDKCLFPYLYGSINIDLKAFYNFAGIEVTYRDATKGFKKKTKSLIGSSSNEIGFFNINTGKFCIGESNKVVEGSSFVLQQGNDRSYFIKNELFHCCSDLVQPVLEVRDDLQNLIAIRKFPFRAYWHTNAGSHMIVTTSQLPTLVWYFNKYVTKQVKKYKQILFWKTEYIYTVTELMKSSEYKFKISGDFKDDGIEVKSIMELPSYIYTMLGISKIWNLRNVSINKVFQMENNSMFVSYVPYNRIAKYALISLMKDGNTQIDNTATFYSDTMLSDTFSTKGAFYTSLDHFEIDFDKFVMLNPMDININISLKFNNNGKDETYELGIVSAELLEKKTYTADEARVYDQNFKFHVERSNNPKLTMKCRTTIFGEKGSNEKTLLYEFNYDDFSKNFYLVLNDDSEVYFKFKRIQPFVSIRSELNSNDENIIAPVFMHNIDNDISIVDGQFEIETEPNQFYFILEFTSSTISLNKNYIIIKCDGITPLVKNVIRITNDVFCIPCDNNIMQIPFRRIDNSFGKLTINYLVSDLNNVNNINMDPYGEDVEFTFKYQIKSFVVPKNYRLNYIKNDRNDDYSMDSYLFNTKDFEIDEETVFCVVWSKTDEPLNLTMFLENAYIEDGQYMISYDVSYIKDILKRSTKTKFNIYVSTNSSSFKAIRCRDKISDINSDGFAIFTFDISENDTIDFYAVCSSKEGKMCEITEISYDGEYQLLHFPSRDGLNITGRGMKNAIIHAPENSTYSYYKTFDGSVNVVRSYSNDTKIIVVVYDIYKGRKSKGLSKSIKSNVTEGSYRQFCINDEERNQLPFSMKYINENIDDFMKSIGAKDDFDITQYDFTEDGCIIVDHDAINGNVFNKLPNNIIDLAVADNQITYDTRGVSFNPSGKKGKIAVIVIGSVLAAVVVLIAIFIVIDIRKKKNRENSEMENTNKERPEMTGNEDI